MSYRGIGQSPESPVTGTAAWLSSICAIMSKDATYGPILNDPYAVHFAGAISDQAASELAKYDDPAARKAFIDERESEQPGALTIVCYRKPEMERLAREALAATGARQLVVMGVGCDTLPLRLARDGVTPTVYEIDRPPVIDFRARVFREHDYAVVEIADNGPGISPAEIERVFEPFYRGEPSRSRKTGGIGLGLAVVRSVARGHGGDVLLVNRPGGGLTVRVLLPLQS